MAAGIKITTKSNALMAVALHEDGVSSNSTVSSKTACILENDGENALYNFPSLNQLHSTCSSNESQRKVPSENSREIVQDVSENEAENSQALIIPKNHVRQDDVEHLAGIEISPGLSLLQQTAAASSPPPHSYRHSRAYRHFKNPPQPHMCIRTTTEDGEELFINVLSWTRIVIPQEPSDPIPLYGGMRVPPGSPRSPPIVFAVMANPEVLKDSGRHSKDAEERRAMIELMCDFVEAMNPGVKLVRNAVILKDRDISGELKDVWNAVQAQRDREREEQMLLQRQQHQQHFHNGTNASAANGSLISCLNSTNNSANLTSTPQQQMFSKSSDDAITMTVDDGTPPRNRKVIHKVQNDNNSSNIDVENEMDMKKPNNCQESLALLAENLDNKLSMISGGEHSDMKHQNNQYNLANNALNNGNNNKEALDMERSSSQLSAVNSNKDLQKQLVGLANGSVPICNDRQISDEDQTIAATSNSNVFTPTPAQTPPIIIAPPAGTATAAAAAAQQAPTKKEKLGGFLPNGCIFPRFTKNKHKDKDKDKDKDKETKAKEKEKNPLLSALKKSKEKKSNANTASGATAANQDEKITSSNINTTANCNQSNYKQQKNCLQQLECGVQKLDLSVSNHHTPHTHIVDNNTNNSSAVTLATNSSATSKSTANSTSNAGGGVSVH